MAVVVAVVVAVATRPVTTAFGARTGGQVDRRTETGTALGTVPSRRIGLSRAGSRRRCALPTTAFFVTPMRRPISAVEWPSAQRALSRSIASAPQSIARPLICSPEHKGW